MMHALVMAVFAIAGATALTVIVASFAENLDKVVRALKAETLPVPTPLPRHFRQLRVSTRPMIAASPLRVSRQPLRVAA